MSEEEERASRGSATLASLLLSNYSIYPGTILTSILLVEIAETFDASVGVVSQIMTLSFVLAFVTAIAMGTLSVRYSAKSLLAAGLALLSLSCLGSAAAPSLWLLFALYSLNGVATNVVFPMLTSLVGEQYPREERAKVMGWVGASGGLSYMLGAPVIAYLASAGGWRLPFVAYAAVVPVAALALTLWSLPATPVQAGGVGLGEGFRAIASKRSALAALGAATMVGASSQSIYVYSFTYLREAQGVSQGQASLLFSATSLMFLLGSYFCGSFTGRLGLKTSIVAALGAALLSQAAYMCLPFRLGAAAIVVAHFFFSLQYSAVNTLMLEQVPEYRGSMMSISSALSYLGYGLGTAVGGAALSAAGWATLNAALCLMGAAAFLLYLYIVEA